MGVHSFHSFGIPGRIGVGVAIGIGIDPQSGIRNQELSEWPNLQMSVYVRRFYGGHTTALTLAGLSERS